jgi:acetyl-CoA carboxylase alpha subunit
LQRCLRELTPLATEQLLAGRYDRFRKLGVYEG